jgi:hypothetical protein
MNSTLPSLVRSLILLAIILVSISAMELEKVSLYVRLDFEKSNILLTSTSISS